MDHALDRRSRQTRKTVDGFRVRRGMRAGPKKTETREFHSLAVFDLHVKGPVASGTPDKVAARPNCFFPRINVGAVVRGLSLIGSAECHTVEINTQTKTATSLVDPPWLPL